ncbi:MAG: topoisomerase C-terminal repeat-containing protein, partial [Gammaproteobacteria bacterium]
GEQVELLAIRPDQHFTEPPPRYSEASLVKTLEEYGIGRPSTYAAIIATLISREYVTLDKRRFQPTDVGRIVNRFLTEHFPQYVDFEFTARLEDELDAVSRGEEQWVPLMGSFWQPFKRLVDEKTENVSRQAVLPGRELGVDPVSGRSVSVRMARFGPVAQIGTKDDPDKPRFASLRADQRIDTLTLEDALALFKLPRELGKTGAGEDISTNIGRFGPYVRYGKNFVSLKGDDSPYTITHERALALIQEHQTAAANKVIREFADAGIRILRGRFGPYITDGTKNARIPKGRDPESLAREECVRLLAEAPAKKATPVKKSAAPRAVKSAPRKAPTRRAVRKQSA